MARTRDDQQARGRSKGGARELGRDRTAGRDDDRARGDTFEDAQDRRHEEYGGFNLGAIQVRTRDRKRRGQGNG